MAKQSSEELAAEQAKVDMNIALYGQGFLLQTADGIKHVPLASMPPDEPPASPAEQWIVDDVVKRNAEKS